MNGTPPPTAVSVPAGSHILVDLTGGPGNVGDWIGLYAVNAADSAILTWQYLSEYDFATRDRQLVGDADIFRTHHRWQL